MGAVYSGPENPILIKHITLSWTALALGIGSDYLAESSRHRLRDFFVLMRQQGQGVGHIVPLPFGLAPWETSSKFVRQLSSVFFLVLISFPVTTKERGMLLLPSRRSQSKT